VQAGLHGGDFALYRLDASVVCTAEIQQKVFFFGKQLLDFFCERRDLPGQVEKFVLTACFFRILCAKLI